MMLDISPVLGEKSAFSQPTTRTVLPRLLYSLWDIPFAMFVYAMLQLITILSKPISFVFFLLFPLHSEYHCSCTVANKSITCVP